jgi:site-specific DNA-methyltransferase (adenine-specific)
MIVSDKPRIDLIHGDCMDYMATLPDNAFELAIVDPPYGMETRGNAQDRFRMGKDLSMINDAKPSAEYFASLFRVSRNQIIWGYNHLSDMLPSCREFIFWHKKQPVVTFSDGELAWTSFEKTAKCFEYPFYLANAKNASEGGKMHPTQKPVALYRWLLHNYAKQGDRILDTHLGSGSSAIACHGMGFDMVGIELDVDYYKASVKRFKEQTAQVAMAL